MSPTELLFRRRFERRAAALTPDVRAAILKAFDALRDSVTEAELERFIRSTAAERLLGEVLSESEVQRIFAETSRTIRTGVEDAGAAIARELRTSLPRITFNVLSPAVIDGVRTLNSRVINTLSDGIRETVRAYVENGLRDGVNPRAIARGLRAVIGLAPNQLAAVDNFRRMLETRDAEALTRALRDRRFDGTIRRALAGEPLTTAQIDTMVAAYRRRFVAFNAETNARTAALDAQKLAHQLTWRDAVARGDIDGGRLFKRWAAVAGPGGDGRNRPEHLALHGEVVGHDESFSNGDMVPGESTFNCRCLAIYFTARDPGSARRPGRGADPLAGVA